jgi:hypothetical protein
MLDERLIPGLKISSTDSFNHLFMVLPDFLQIVIPACEHIQTDRLISIPIRFQDAGDKWVIEAVIDQEMQITMFFMWDLYLCAPQFLPGAGDKGSQFGLILLGKLLDCFIPECKLYMIAQLRILSEVLVVECERIAQTLPDGGSEGVGTPPRSQPRPDLHQTKRSCYFELLAQRGNADTQLPAQFREGWEFILRFLMEGKVAQKLRHIGGNSFSKYHSMINQINGFYDYLPQKSM